MAWTNSDVAEVPHGIYMEIESLRLDFYVLYIALRPNTRASEEKPREKRKRKKKTRNREGEKIEIGDPGARGMTRN